MDGHVSGCGCAYCRSRREHPICSNLTFRTAIWGKLCLYPNDIDCVIPLLLVSCGYLWAIAWLGVCLVNGLPMAVRLPPGLRTYVAEKGTVDLAGLLAGAGLSDRVFAHRSLQTQ